ncbi:MAG: cytidylate kinase-like family protein [Nitrospiraceae bacterium]|nr:cytidylate kinase-like family protein [Nitrospiraceae bacterium]
MGKEKEKEKILITIARQFGSGGSFIGKSLAGRLGFRYFDREILRQAAGIIGAEESTLSERDEKLSGFLEDVIRPFIVGSPETAYMPPPLHAVYDRDLFEAESKIIRKIGAEYDCVIMGRAARQVLAGRPGLVNVFIHAPVDFRVARIMDLYKMSDAAEAEKLVEKSDRHRARFTEAMTGEDWTDLRNYHLSIDTERAGLNAAQEMILLLVEQVKRRENPGRS